MKKILLLLVLILLFSSVLKSQTLKLELKNVHSLVEISISYNTVGFNDSSYTMKDTIIAINKLKGGGIYRITVQNYLINYKNTYYSSEVITNSYFKIDFDSVQTSIERSERQRDSITQYTREDLLSRAVDVVSEMYERTGYYENKIKNKSPMKAADILYDEGFGRRYDFGSSNFYTIYGVRWTFDNGDFYTIDVKIWYSYGYGKSFYEILQSAYLKGYGYILINNKETDLGNKLLNDE